MPCAAGRSQLFVECGGGGEWGFYDLMQIPKLVEWLESGSDAEQELAEDIYESFDVAMHPATDTTGPEVTAVFMVVDAFR